MITHGTRYSDLRAFHYASQGRFEFRGLYRTEHFPIPGLDRPNRRTSSFRFIHPITTLVNRTGSDLEELSLEPRDALTLWECMKKFQTPNFPLDDSLNPSRVFSGVPKKSDVLAWTRRLKAVLATWLRDTTSPFEQVRRTLGPYAQPDRSPNDDGKQASSKPQSAPTQSALKQERLSVFSLLCDLYKEDGLPAILFNYDRVECERMLAFVLVQLERSEKEWKEWSTEWQKDIKDYNLWKTSKDKRKVSKKTTEKRTKDEKMREEASAEISRWELFDPEWPLDQFSFADASRLGRSELEEFIKSLEGTLALGINMPCKTVAFIGDSTYLTTLNYRQGAGRAGRRGFDLLGNVVFTNISKTRAYELMSSRLPDLKGHFPLTTTLILRILGLIDVTGNTSFTSGIVKSLLTQNRLYLGGAEAGKSIQHHLRFSVEYLQRQHLLSADGKPINFAGLVGHLYFTENAVFAFHSLLKGGYFHHLCADVDRDAIDTLRTLGLVMAHLFNRIRVRSLGLRASEKEYTDSSAFLLPRLPQDAEDLLIRHNAETLDIFKTYASTYIDQYLADAPDHHLPLTGIAVGGEQSRMIDLHSDFTPTKLRSPFSALSGHTDDFKSIHELCTDIRSGVFLEESAIPYIPIWPHDLSVPLNSYIYDFLKHGDYAALTRDNKIKQGDVWFLLRDFSLVLATIVASLTNFIKADSSIDDVDMIDIEDVGETPDENTSAQATEAPKEMNHSTAPRKVSKKKIAESWDDEEEDTDREEDASFGPTREAASPTLEMPSWGKDGKGLVNVLRAFTLLKEDFDEKFHKAWA
ncbi:hypothetical protein ONZ43_g463 [Nemania bipapillata]|uniref:Uncharacterized protein n=1 Tax=Nemania bipapillata TaxID=110536 RepID=A0ACC2J862_9PEZI|nr:hypothetical protein ONZ43_g463 [Nemania bipapillata]